MTFSLLVNDKSVDNIERNMAKASVLCVMDEGAKVGTPLIGAKGASFLFDVDGKRIMFDTGRSGRYLIHNMGVLHIKADSVDAVVISNPSIEHVGGLNAFMTNRTVPVDVYAVPEVWRCKRPLGKLISDDNAGGVHMRDAGSEWIQLTEHLFLSPVIGGGNEMAMVLRTNEGPMVFSARATEGIGSTLGAVKDRFHIIRGLVGGIYMHKLKQPAVNGIASVITEEYSVNELYINGCAGREGIQKLRVATSNDKIKDFFAGDELVFTV